jgi:hypothetical protein
MSVQHICKNCGNQFYGKYCNQCGEKVYGHHDKSLLHVLEEAFHFITHFEGSFFTTIKTIVKSPGQLSLNYCNGIRKKYFKPVSLFFMLVVMYLLFPRFEGLNMKLNNYVNSADDYAWLAVPLVKSKMKKQQVPFKTVAEQYHKKSPSVSKLSLFTLIPFTALVLMLLFYSTRKYYFDHIIISLELISIFIGLNYLLIPFISFVSEKINPSFASFFWDDNLWWGRFMFLLNLYIISIACKKFYQQHWLWVIPKAVIFIYLFGEAIFYLYRLIVLFVTLTLC